MGYIASNKEHNGKIDQLKHDNYCVHCVRGMQCCLRAKSYGNKLMGKLVQYNGRGCYQSCRFYIFYKRAFFIEFQGVIALKRLPFDKTGEYVANCYSHYYYIKYL